MDFLQSLHLDGIVRKAGTAILVCPLGLIDAHAFVHFLLLVRGLPERVLFIRPRAEHVPHVPATEEAMLTSLGRGMHVVDLRYGFDDDIDLPRALGRALGPSLDPATTRYYVVDGRVPVRRALRGWPRWRQWLFAALSAACVPAAEYFCLPAESTTKIPMRASDV